MTENASIKFKFKKKIVFCYIRIDTMFTYKASVFNLQKQTPVADTKRVLKPLVPSSRPPLDVFFVKFANYKFCLNFRPVRE